MKTILVVDDDERISAAVAIRLRAAGYEPVTASDGVKGLELALVHEVCLVITDIWMTVGNGFSLAHRLRTALPRVPVLFMTASKRPGLREMAAQTGAAGFFEKPFDMQAMMAAVEICVGPAENGASDSPEVAAESEPAPPSPDPGCQANSPDSPPTETQEPASLSPSDSLSVDSAEPPPAEIPATETPPPLPPLPAPEPKQAASVAPPSLSTESAGSSTLETPPIEPVPVSLTDLTENVPQPACPQVEEPLAQVLDETALPKESAESSCASDSESGAISPQTSPEPPAEVSRTLPSAELIGSRRILVAGTDERQTNPLAVRFRDLGHEVWEAHDALGAVQQAMERQPDLAIIDLAIPGSTGFKVARQVQTLVSNPATIIFTTDKKRKEYRSLAEQLGAAGLFEKPYDVEDLLHAAFMALENAASAMS